VSRFAKALLAGALVLGLLYLAAARLPLPAGASQGRVSGFVVSQVHYGIVGTRVTTVSFLLSPANPTHVSVSLDGMSFTPCLLNGAAAVCPVSTPVAELHSLSVAAS